MMVNAFITDTTVFTTSRPAVEWPTMLEQALHGLPKRCVFRNDRVNALLVGLKHGQVVALGPWSTAFLLVVTFGSLDFVMAGHLLSMRETDSTGIAPLVCCELRTPDTADFLLMNLTPPSEGSNDCPFTVLEHNRRPPTQT
jgi:hypothetical protein